MNIKLFSLALLCVPVLCQAGSYFTTSYSVDLTNFPNSITNIVMEETPAASYAARMNYLGPESGIAAANDVTVLENPFLNTGTDPNTVSLGMGIVQNLPGDTDGQKHIVLFMSPAAALIANGLDWATAFPDTDEDQLISDLTLGTSGGLNWGNDFNTLQSGLANATDFLNLLYTPGGITGPGPNPTVTSPYFALPAPGADATDFSVVAFSSGQVIGSGSVTQTFFQDTSDAPEPATMGTLLFGLLAAARLRKILRQEISHRSLI